jgi:hypothetical protein
MLEVRKNVTQEELRSWRRDLPKGHRRDVLFQVRTTGVDQIESQGDTGYVSRPKSTFGRRDARDVVAALDQRRVDSLQRLATQDKDFYQRYLAFLRLKNPGLAHLDDQTFIAAAMRAVHEEAAKVAWRNLKRDQPLTNTGGGG